MRCTSSSSGQTVYDMRGFVAATISPPIVLSPTGIARNGHAGRRPGRQSGGLGGVPPPAGLADRDSEANGDRYSDPIADPDHYQPALAHFYGNTNSTTDEHAHTGCAYHPYRPFWRELLLDCRLVRHYSRGHYGG